GAGRGGGHAPPRSARGLLAAGVARRTLSAAAASLWQGCARSPSPACKGGGPAGRACPGAPGWRYNSGNPIGPRARRSPRSVFFLRGFLMPTIPLTRRGAALLKDELQKLKSVERPAVITAIAEARAQGELSENAEYDGAREP